MISWCCNIVSIVKSNKESWRQPFFWWGTWSLRRIKRELKINAFFWQSTTFFGMNFGPFVEGKGNNNLFWINSSGNILNDSFDIFLFWVMSFLTEKLAVPRIQEMTDMRSQHYEWSSCPLWTHTASMSTSSSSFPSSPRRRFNQKKNYHRHHLWMRDHLGLKDRGAAWSQTHWWSHSFLRHKVHQSSIAI